MKRPNASRGVTKLKGYADGGRVNTFRSDAEKKVDALYGGKMTPAAPVAESGGYLKQSFEESATGKLFKGVGKRFKEE